MFTGLVTDVGEVLAVTPQDGGIIRFRLACSYPLEGITMGASIACAGTCLTVVEFGAEASHTWFDVEAASETLALTSLRQWAVGTRVNLEKSLRLGDEMGGHLVTGHVDETAVITGITEEGEAARFTFKAPARLMPMIAAKGSVALDGTSLTVNHVQDDTFSILLIPHTLAVTTWGERLEGDRVNLEVDLMARYAARLAQSTKIG